MILWFRKHYETPTKIKNALLAKKMQKGMQKERIDKHSAPFLVWTRNNVRSREMRCWSTRAVARFREALHIKLNLLQKVRRSPARICLYSFERLSFLKNKVAPLVGSLSFELLRRNMDEHPPIQALTLLCQLLATTLQQTYLKIAEFWCLLAIEEDNVNASAHVFSQTTMWLKI